MNDKDQIFWDALIDKNDGKKVKKLKKYTKGIDSKRLAELFAIDKEEVERVRASRIYGMFLRIDGDRSGGITASEIAQALGSLGCEVSPKVVQAVMRTSDKDGDGEISFEEFLGVVVSKSKLKKNKAQMIEVIKKLGEDQNTEVTVDNLRSAWSLIIGLKLTSHEANALLAQAESSDGVVTKEDFRRMWLSA